MLTRVYLAGPMSGLPRYNFDAFADATRALRLLGFAVWSPHERDLSEGFDPDHGLTEQGFDLREALEADVAAVLASDVVALLPGWEDSPGAMVEVVTAEAAGLPWMPLAELVAEVAEPGLTPTG